MLCPPFPQHLPNPEGPQPVLIICDDEHAILQLFLPNKVYSTFALIILLICVKMRPRMPQRAMLSMYKEGYSTSGTSNAPKTAMIIGSYII